MNKVALGGNRIHSGNKMDVNMHGYDRATFNLNKRWISTMAPGVLTPVLNCIALPGDSWDMDYNADVLTTPLTGPLFGKFDFAVDTYLTPLRIYIPKLQMNMVDIGLEMENVFLPVFTWTSKPYTAPGGVTEVDYDNIETNPSCLMANLGFRGGVFAQTETTTTQNGVKWLIYWDTFKQYYANKQEVNAWVIHTPQILVTDFVDQIDIINPITGTETLPQDAPNANIPVTNLSKIQVIYSGAQPNPDAIMINFSNGQRLPLSAIATFENTTPALTDNYNVNNAPILAFAMTFSDKTPDEIQAGPIALVSFPLKNIDGIKRDILSNALTEIPYNINTYDETPYNLILGNNQGANLSSMEGMGVITYASDFANNWIRTETITNVTTMSAVAIVDNKFSMDAFLLHEKIYNMLNRVALSGGTYNDWQVAMYDTKPFVAASNPMYMGGLRKEIVFSQVVSNAATGDGTQPLGTIAGKGHMGQKHKGGSVNIKVGEMSYVTALAHITPQIVYSQGNAFDNDFKTMNDMFKPALNGIGFQDTPTNKFAWWSKEWTGTVDVTRSAGKQTAWIDYQTNFDTAHGDFAIKNNSMWMTLNRRYSPDPATGEILDMSTYIDPQKFNYIFANTALDAQNFWVQIAIKAIVRRKMAANQIPNL